MVLAALALLFSTTAHAAPGANLQTTLIAPSSANVYAPATWQVEVRNNGNRNASNTTLVVELPETNTSPAVYVMGTLGTMSSACSQVGTELRCNLGTVRRGTSTTVSFEISLPESAGSLDFTATADSTTAEQNPADDQDSATATLLYTSPAFTAPADVSVQHCTGTGLEAWFECTLFPSSISGHAATWNADGTISFAGMPDYGGYWEVDGEELWFQYTLLGSPVAEFLGRGVDADCWEGLTTFIPDDGYVSPYQVCLD